MSLNVTFRNLDSSDAIREYATGRVTRVKKYIESPFDANIVLSVEKFRHIAEITISFDGATINGQEETGDLYSAIDMVMDKIERQVKKLRLKRITKTASTLYLQLLIHFHIKGIPFCFPPPQRKTEKRTPLRPLRLCGE